MSSSPPEFFDVERLTAALVAKHRRVITPQMLDDFNLYALVSTTVVDTELVLRGDLSVEDFEQRT